MEGVLVLAGFLTAIGHMLGGVTWSEAAAQASLASEVLGMDQIAGGRRRDAADALAGPSAASEQM